MPVVVVDQLEPVDIDERDGDLVAGSGLLVHVDVQRAAIGQAGQTVGLAQTFESGNLNQSEAAQDCDCSGVTDDADCSDREAGKAGQPRPRGEHREKGAEQRRQDHYRREHEHLRTEFPASGGCCHTCSPDAFAPLPIAG